MRKTVIAAFAMTAALAFGGAVEHGSVIGAAAVGWLVPVAYAVIAWSERRNRIIKQAIRKAKYEQMEREMFLAEPREK